MSQIGYMMLAAGLGPAGYVFAIFHLLTHGFFKAGHVPRCRFGDARHERRREHAPLRRPAQVHAGHLRDVRPSATWRSWASRRSPASSARTTSSRSPSRRTRWSAVCAARRRDHGVLHDPADDDDLLRREALEEDVHPHESPKVMTGPLIVLAILSLVGGALYFVGHWIVKWLEPVTGFEEAEPPIGAAGDDADHPRGRASSAPPSVSCCSAGTSRAWHRSRSRRSPPSPAVTCTATR